MVNVLIVHFIPKSQKSNPWGIKKGPSKLDPFNNP